MDNGAPCVRMKMAVAARVRAHNASNRESHQAGRVVLFDLSCICHHINGDVKREFHTVQLIPRLHNLCWTAGMSGVHTDLMRAIDAIVSEDLALGFYPACQPPDPQWKRHTHALMTMSFSRLKFVHFHQGHGASQVEKFDRLQREGEELFDGDL
eukprot:10409997-Karenia_brevis.AAC.1